MRITGRTRFFAILGDPVAHMRAPQVMQPLLDELGHDVAVIPLHVRPDGLALMLDALRRWENLAGVGVTMPHKEQAAVLLDRVSDQAAAVGAVNTIRREPTGELVGTVTDGDGFVAALRRHERDPAGRSVLLVGAGGAGSAIAHALAAAGVRELTIANRTAERAQRLVRQVAAARPACEVRVGPAEVDDHDLVVNATQLGLRADDPLPVPAAGIRPPTAFAEAVMSPPETALLAHARRAGCATVPGTAMFEQQLSLIFEFLALDGAGRSVS